MHDKDHALEWVISEAYRILEEDNSDRSVNLRGYIDQHLPEYLTFMTD
jgi:hypothetical protein